MEIEYLYNHRNINRITYFNFEDITFKYLSITYFQITLDFTVFLYISQLYVKRKLRIKEKSISTLL